MVSEEDSSVLRGFDRITPGTSEVRVIAGFEDFVADDGVKNTDLDLQAVADGGAQDDIGVLDGEVSARSARKLATGAIGRRIVADRVRSEEEADVIARSPRGFVQRFADVQFNHVQVEAVLLVRAEGNAHRRAAEAGG